MIALQIQGLHASSGVAANPMVTTDAVLLPLHDVVMPLTQRHVSQLRPCAVRSAYRPFLRPFFGRPLHAAVFAANGAGQKTQQAPKGKHNKKQGGKKDKEEDGPYSATVKLPVTDFNLRANSVVREPEIQNFWTEHKVYEALLEGDAEAFTLHDGPPYANGDLHIGHALNKILKDFINRYQLLQGRKARFVPGWDTHGLPIELKVLQSLPEKERRALGPVELRRKAKEFALKTIDAQRNQFKRYGVWGDWEQPYVTLDPAYEAAQLQVFGKMFLNGHIYRGRKPVHWSPSSRTALAEAELEYPEGHKSRSIYVGMPLTQAGAKVPAELALHLQGAAFAIWTTTPWTIPANLAVAINDQLDYCVVQAQGEGAAGWTSSKLIIAKDLVDKLQDKFGCQLSVLATFKGAELEGCKYRHPLFDRASPVVVGGDYITTETGTGLVHTAPGHGQEDYLVGQRYGLPLLSPVDDAGNFTEEAGQFSGLSVQGEGNAAVINALREAGVLLKEEQYEHKYPYDWRTKKPTIFRATSQWFASVEGFRSDALNAIREVTWIPAGGFNRITNMTEGRSDWCISRQRKWGVPIPVFYDENTGEPLMTEETINHVTSIVRQHGSDAWWGMSTEELLPPSLRHMAPTLRKGEDTMDVWFDSGSSWAGVLQSVPGLQYPADLYLEGSDQHRGWFQSSLLTSVAAFGKAPYRQVLTHGFVLDEKGMKMSKSLGNVVDPRSVIEGGKDQKNEPPYGADVLRLWVASVDYTSDVMIGPGIIRQTADFYRKIRGTLRFLLGNLHDFDPATHSMPYDSLPSVDRFILHRLSTLVNEMASAFNTYQFYKIYQSVQRFVVVDLSNFYLDVAKDRLYIRDANDPARRSCQTVLNALLRGLLGGLAPLTPHMAEDAWLNLPYQRPATSVFQAGWAATPEQWLALPQEDLFLWASVLQLRDAVNATLEKARVAKLIGSSLEARVLLHVSDATLHSRLQELDRQRNGADDLRYLFLVSQVELVSEPSAAKLAPHWDTVAASSSSSAASEGSETANSTAVAAATPVTPGQAQAEITVGVATALGAKCARCWNYSESLGAPAHSHADVCERCGPVLQAQGFTKSSAATAAAQPVAA